MKRLDVNTTTIIILILLAVQMLWFAGVIGYNIWGNGYLYHVDQPVEVRQVEPGNVVLRMTSYSRLTMNATCSYKLFCEDEPVVVIGYSEPCDVRKGKTTVLYKYDVPERLQGECHMEGIVGYSPAHIWGLYLNYAWESEIFTPR